MYGIKIPWEDYEHATMQLDAPNGKILWQDCCTEQLEMKQLHQYQTLKKDILGIGTPPPVAYICIKVHLIKFFASRRSEKPGYPL
jgi:hypothetical protein